VIRRDGGVVVSVTFRLRDDDDDDDGEEIFAANGQLRFTDSRGTRGIALPALLIPVRVIAPAPRPVEVARLRLDRIDARFRATWERRGGLAIFGLPLTEPRTLDDGTVIQVFERARMGGSGEVRLGRLAAELGYGAPPSIGADDLDDDDRPWYRPETGHLVGAPFRALWGRPGALLIFGLPIGPLVLDDDGRETQCFERVCMQRFPELRGTPSEVQLRLLGVELLTRDDD
jgi:hypothetical protein